MKELQVFKKSSDFSLVEITLDGGTVRCYTGPTAQVESLIAAVDELKEYLKSRDDWVEMQERHRLDLEASK